MFKVGEIVNYGIEGVCVIKDIRTENFRSLKAKEEYYILSPIKTPSSLIYVPVSNKLLTDRMRKLLSHDEIVGLVEELRDRRFDWISDSRVRNAEFKRILGEADRVSLIILVNTIVARMRSTDLNEKRTTLSDESILKHAQKMLFDEFSQTCDIKDIGDLMNLLQLSNEAL